MMDSINDRCIRIPVSLLRAGTWDTPYSAALLAALAAQPAAFVARVVFAAQEDPMQWPQHHRDLFRARGARPRTVARQSFRNA